VPFTFTDEFKGNASVAGSQASDDWFRGPAA